MTKFQVKPDDPLPLYYQVYTSLQERIRSDEFKTGDALPSERQLVRDYGVSRITVIKALDLLDNDGLIDRQQGRGSFVLDIQDEQEGETCERIAFCIPTFADSYITSVLIGATRVAMQHGIQLQIIGVDKEEKEAGYIRKAVRDGANGVILFPRARYPDSHLYEEILQTRYPLVLLDRHYPDLPTNYVIFDDEGAAYALTSTLIRKGHQRIAICPGHEVRVSSVHNRLRGYQQALIDHGLPYDEDLVCLDVYENLSPASLNHLQSTYTRLFDHICRDHFTAMIAINYFVALQMNIDLMKIKTERLQAALDGDGDKAGCSLNIAIGAISHKYFAHDQASLAVCALQSGAHLGEQGMHMLLEYVNEPIRDTPRGISLPMEVVELD